jgi:hypothetical protein
MKKSPDYLQTHRKSCVLRSSMSTRPNTWPSATNELLTTTLFKLANQYPELTYAEYFSDPISIANDHRAVTYREFANAVHATAWWIEEIVGKPKGQNGSEAMVYFGPNDFRYDILVLASIVVGYKVRDQLHNALFRREKG